jgi:hypothetical protein
VSLLQLLLHCRAATICGAIPFCSHPLLLLLLLLPILMLLLQTPQLVSLLQQCCSGERADLQLNVVSALGQLARDQQVTAAAVMEAKGAITFAT